MYLCGNWWGLLCTFVYNKNENDRFSLCWLLFVWLRDKVAINRRFEAWGNDYSLNENPCHTCFLLGLISKYHGLEKCVCVFFHVYKLASLVEGKLWHFLTVSLTSEIKATSIVLNYLVATQSLRKNALWTKYRNHFLQTGFCFCFFTYF